MAIGERLQVVIDGSAAGLIRELDKVSKVTEKSLGESTTRTQKFGVALQRVSPIALGAGAALLSGFGAATVATVKFDKAMSEVGAVAGATGGELDKLRQAAIDAGRDTAFSATEAATAVGELSKAGIGTADILGGALRGALDLAAAGSLDLKTAAEIAAQAMNIFRLKGEDVARIADVLAAGANKSAADVTSLGEGLSNVGAVANQTGLSLEDTVAVLSLFSDNALDGAESGTTLRSMLLRIQAPSGAAAAELDRLGIVAYDAGGNFVGLEKFAGSLRSALKNLTPEQRNAALATIFGSRAVQAASILYDRGAKGVREYTKAVGEQGAAQDVAAKKMDNLAGDLEKLKGSIETGLIGTGSQATGVLRGLVQGADSAVSSFSDLPGPIQTVGVTIAGISGVGLTAAGAVGQLAFQLNQGGLAFDRLKEKAAGGSLAAQRFSTAIKGIGAVAALAGPVYALINALGFLDDTLTDSFSKSVAASGKSTKALTAGFREVIAEGREAADQGVTNADRVTRAEEISNQKRKLGAEAAAKAFRDLARDNIGAAERLLDSIRKQPDEYERLGVSVSQLEGILGRQAGAQKRANDDTQRGTSLIEGNTAAVDENTDALNARQEAVIAGFSSEIAALQAQERFNEAVSSGAPLLDQQSQALDTAAAMAKRAADQYVAMTGEQFSAEQQSAAFRSALVTLAGQVDGPLKAAILNYIASLDRIPLEKNTRVTADTSSAEESVANFRRQLENTEFRIKVNAGEIAFPVGSAGSLRRRASGGPVSAGQAYIVGEERPEVFVPNQSGTILPRVPTGGGVTNVFNIDARGSTMTEAQFERIATRAVERGWREMAAMAGQG